jgi:hypothetical protein
MGEYADDLIDAGFDDWAAESIGNAMCPGCGCNSFNGYECDECGFSIR